MTRHLRRAALFLPLMLIACGPQTPQDARAAAIAKCETRFGRAALANGADSAGANALCTCMTDRLANAGLEITDMLGPQRSRVEAIGRSCAAQAGITLPAAG